MEPPRTCALCAARIAAEAEWCGRCHAPVARPEEPPKFAHADAFLGPPVPRRHSRWAKTDVSYGPFGRIAATILLCVLPAWWGLNYSFITAIMWIFVIGPLLLRSIWKKTALRT